MKPIIEYLQYMREEAIPLTAHTVTIALGASESAEVDLGGEALVAVVSPAALEATTARLSIKHGIVSGTRYPRIAADGSGAESIAIEASKESVAQITDLPGLYFTSFVAETAAGVAVVQTAERVFTVYTRPVWGGCECRQATR
jgi:hypothetical protein